MIEPLTFDNGDLIIVPVHRGARAVVFPVVTNFHRMARRPGGPSRREALRNARQELWRFVDRTMRPGDERAAR
jgi:hypothetical protein